MKLISMTDFVLQEQKGGQQVNSITSQLHYRLRCIKKYAEFLKQEIKIEMLVPCDENGEILERPVFQENFSEEQLCDFQILREEFEEAESNVLFYDVDYFYDEGRLTIKFGDRFTHFEDLKNGYIIEDLACWYNLSIKPNIVQRIFG